MMHNELLHVNLPPVTSFSTKNILKLDLVFSSRGWRIPLKFEHFKIEKLPILKVVEVTTFIKNQS